MYNTNVVYVLLLENRNATISAQCNAAALFKPTRSEIWKTNFLWQPVSCIFFHSHISTTKSIQFHINFIDSHSYSTTGIRYFITQRKTMPEIQNSIQILYGRITSSN